MAERKKSDLSRAFSEDGARKTHVGGQALIEGIMMRGKYNWSVAVREPSGSIYTEEHDLASGKQKNGWMHWPLVRGCRALVESLMLGYQALEIAAMHAFADEIDEDAAKAEVAGERANVAGHVDGAADSADDARPLEHAQGDAAGSDDCANAEGSPRQADASSATVVAAPAVAVPKEAHKFSWKDDFGRPEVMIDGLGAQRTLEVVEEEPDGTVETIAWSDVTDEVNAKLARGGSGAEPGANVASTADGLPAANGPESEALRASTAPAAEDVPTATKSEKQGFLDKEVEFGHKEMVVSLVLGLVLGVVLFIVAPAAVTNLIVGEYDSNTLLWNVVDGLLRVAVFVFYIWLIGRMQDIKRMFGYHGAEHKTIHCYEHGLPLTPENARSFPRLHVRCGTAFLIMVMIIAILVYTITPINGLISAWGVPDGLPKLALVIVARIVLMPVIAGISYEITVRWAGSHPENPLVKVVLWPGMQMQYLTTREPDDGQIECAIAAMQLVLEREEAEAAKAS